ncbi:MAG: hypothetical protein JSS55_16970 [Proteobacteria bacterium]|nr:hypothetical protein [Pseudomonadota bacterium]
MEIEAARILENLANELAKIRPMGNAQILFYAEAGDNWSGGSIFYERGGQVQFEGPSNDIFILVEDLWFEAPSDKKWRGITIFVDGDEFRTEFDYGEGWSEEEDEGDRRIPIVRAHFGDKPIYYPPIEGLEPWD